MKRSGRISIRMTGFWMERSNGLANAAEDGTYSIRMAGLWMEQSNGLADAAG